MSGAALIVNLITGTEKSEVVMENKTMMMTEGELIEEIEDWITARTKEADVLSGKGEPVESLTEAIMVCGGLLLLFKACKFAPTQELCVVALQAIMQGPDHVHRLTDIINGVHSGLYVILQTKNVDALIGPPAGRA